MKTFMYLLAAISLPAATYAQKGFYLSASGGAGISNTGEHHYGPAYSITQSAIFHYNAKLTAGYQTGHWRFQTGLQYLISGYQLNRLLFGSEFKPDEPIPTGTGKFRLTHKHIGIPVQAAYVIPVSSRLNLVPTLGVLTTYNIGASTWLREQEGKQARRGNYSADAFNDQFNRISVWGTAAFYFEYKLNDRFGLFGGPSASYMATDLQKHSDSPFADNASQRSYCFSADLGVIFRL